MGIQHNVASSAASMQMRHKRLTESCYRYLHPTRRQSSTLLRPCAYVPLIPCAHPVASWPSPACSWKRRHPVPSGVCLLPTALTTLTLRTHRLNYTEPCLQESAFTPAVISGITPQKSDMPAVCFHSCHIPPSGSVEALELVRSSSKASIGAPAPFLQAQGAKGKGRPPGSLFELLQRTRTAAGSR